MSYFESAPKGAAETRKLVADFVGQLASGVTILSASISHSVYSGTTSSIGHTSATIDGSKVSTLLSGGQAGTIYQVNVQATLSDGQILRQSTLLAVTPNAL